ncbi:MAG: response regulator transcription factor [Chloroflexota bacterium]
MEPRNNRILVVDDDRETVRLLRAYLENANYQVLTAYDGEQALHVLRRERPNLILLDIMMPERDGLSLTQLMRNDPALKGIPIIMLTARVEDADIVLGLEMGAADYVTKPFNPREVLARVRARLRDHYQTPDEPVMSFADLRLDPYQREVVVRGALVDLTPIEYQILYTLMSNIGQVFTRADLISSAFQDDYDSLERSLDTHIKNLRKKIEVDTRNPEYILTVYGVGYRLGRLERL